MKSTFAQAVMLANRVKKTARHVRKWAVERRCPATVSTTVTFPKSQWSSTGTKAICISLSLHGRMMMG